MQAVKLPVMANHYPCNCRVTMLMLSPVTGPTYSSTSPFSRTMCYELFSATRPKLPVLVLSLCRQPLTHCHELSTTINPSLSQQQE